MKMRHCICIYSVWYHQHVDSSASFQMHPQLTYNFRSSAFSSHFGYLTARSVAILHSSAMPSTSQLAPRQTECCPLVTSVCCVCGRKLGALLVLQTANCAGEAK